MSVEAGQRFVPSRPCPVCGGHEQKPRGGGERCFGFLSEDGAWAHCTREEYAGGLERGRKSETYAHRLTGGCSCGVRHDPGKGGVNGQRPKQSKIAETYDYRGADGTLRFQTVRFEPKDFRQRRPNGKGGWEWDLKNVPPVLYRLPEVLKAAESGRIVYIVEGEKDADRLRSFGLTATTCPLGAGKWRDNYSEALRGGHIVIVPDVDTPGRSHAQHVAASVLGKAASVRVLELADMHGKGDVSDWLDAGHDVEELGHMVREASEWKPMLESEPVGRLLDSVESEQVSWLWPGRIPRGKLTLIDGDPGTGKSAMTMDLAARVSVGRTFPDDSLCERGGVVLLSAEDGLPDTIRPRLEAAGADLGSILSLATIADGDSERLLSIPEDLGIIKRGIERVDAQLVIVDPLMAFLSGAVNSHRDQDVRRALAPLAKLAEETGAAVVVVRHLNKGSDGNALYRGGGSIGIIGAARSALLVAKHPEDDRKRVLANLKSNLAGAAGSLAFTLDGAANGAVRVEWQGETPLDASALLAPPMNDEERRELGALRDAVAELLKENAGVWEGQPQELYNELADLDLAALPDRPDELTKRLKKIASTGQIFTMSTGRERRGETVVRLLKLVSRERPGQEPLNGDNGVHSVHRLDNIRG